MRTLWTHDRTGGEVHQIGLTLLFFTPLPFVDASSTWALHIDKSHRIIIAPQEYLPELALPPLPPCF